MLGPVADQVADELRTLVAGSGAMQTEAAPEPAVEDLIGESDRHRLARAFGGEHNIRRMEVRGGRVRIEVDDRDAVDETAAAGHPWAWVADRVAHVLLRQTTSGAG